MPDYIWKSAAGEIKTGRPFGIAGILNVTPDSFYDGGCYSTTETGVKQAEKLLEEGADILDIGAESSRPGAKPLSPDQEISRLLPVLNAIKKQIDPIISVDTRNAPTAAAALEGGAAIINDISACRRDPRLLDVLAQYRPAYILMHSQGRPETMQVSPHYEDVISEIKLFFERYLGKMIKAGLPEEHIALDPGIGFGKTLAHNLQILAHMDEFLEFGRPLLIGVSMKSMFGDLLGQEKKERGESVAVASALLWQKGVFWHRVHEPARTRAALLIAQSLRKA